MADYADISQDGSPVGKQSHIQVLAKPGVR